MARFARVLASGNAHQVMQRENHRRKVPFRDSDCEAYLELFAEVGLKRAEARQRACRTGRPLGSGPYVARLGAELGRNLLKQKPGRKKPPEMN